MKRDRKALLKRFSEKTAARPQVEAWLSISEKDAPSTLSVRFSEGGRMEVLTFEKSASTYALHTQIRKAFAGIFTCDQIREVALDLSGLDSVTAALTLEAVASLASLSAWRPETFGKKTASVKKLPDLTIRLRSKLAPAKAKVLFDKGLGLAAANNLVRTLADLPPNVLNPGEYRKRVFAFAKSHGMQTEFMDTKALIKKGAGAFMAVVQADPNTESGILHLTVKAKGKKPKGRVAFVGKGLCYDTGGYNIKTGDYMNGMHRDMTGSAIAFALAGYMQKFRPDVEVHVYLAIAENHISPTGFKPDEVVTAVNGMSIEVVNTDAEGRMVLSDTLAIASEIKPDLIMDFATLTGAAMRSVDTRRSCVFSNRPKLGELAVRCGDASGERVWNFPIGDDYAEPLKESKVADTLQCLMTRNSDHIYAATFLSQFVDENIPWLHVDLSSAENKGGLGLVATETTGFGVRLAAEVVDQFI